MVVLTRRNLVHVRREPAQLSDATVQPVLFTVLFVDIFGAAMVLPGGGSYKDFAIGGLVTMNLTTAPMGTAVGLSSDLATGVINRFRRCRWPAAPCSPVGPCPTCSSSLLCGTIVVLTGLVRRLAARQRHARRGRRPRRGRAFAFALSWFCACVGLLAGDPESAQAVGLVILFPVAFVSSAFVPTEGLPALMRIIADWNPVSAVAASCRELFGNPNPAALSDTFPADHPVMMALLWSAAIIAVCAPIASHLLRATTD